MKKTLSMLLLCSGIIYAAASDAIVTIDGKDINTDYLNVVLERNYPNVSLNQLSDEQKKVLVQQVIEKKVLSKEAKKLGLDKKERFKKSLEVLSDDLLVAQLVEHEREKITVSNDEIKAMYMAIKPTVNTQLHLRQLVLNTQEGAEATIKKLQDSKHEEVLKIFQELSVASLDSTSVKTQGDLGWISVEKIVEPFRSALVNTKPHEVVKTPIKGQMGWHVIYLDEVKPQREATIEESKAALENAVKNEKLQKIVQEKIDKLKRESKIVESSK